MGDTTLAPQPVSIERFRRLAEAWRQQRGLTSSLTEMALTAAYQEIIGMGPAAIPFLLEELKREPDHWFWALRCISGVDPVPRDAQGSLIAMSDAWLEWGQQQGYC